LSLSQLGFRIARQVFRESIPADQLEMIVHEAINFPAPLVTVKEKEYVLELYHGPTLAFKDFGARFMARLMRWLTRDDDGLLTVLVATSGDTGGAVASAFHKVPGTRVIILYPKGKVSGLQEKQLTTLGDNITALEIEGTFDDCQRLVKSAFLKREMSERMNLTSANSINISRLVPQSFYYFDAARNLPEGAKPTFVIPSGNFGNLTAGLFAEEMGLPVEQFVAATNRNDVVPVYLKEGEYRPRPSVATISNAMDVGAPSNFARMESIFGSEWERMRSRIAGFAYDDEMTRDTIRRVNAETGYSLEPHGAVGWMAAEAWRKDHPEAHTVVLETAHPSKFLDVMEEELGESAIEIPERLACLADREKVAIQLGTDESAFQDWLEGME
jgi:threonine synthase